MVSKTFCILVLSAKVAFALEGLTQLAYLWLKVPPEIVVWISDTFDYNFGIKNDFIEYSKESC